MIIVTGTKRSGTSLWMQILDQGGIPYIGDKFPKLWADSIRESNPKGFYESINLRNGICFLTNPDKNGNYISPEDGKGKAIKLFIPGLVITDLAYVEYVIATIRHWKTYENSIEKMWKIEEDWWIDKIEKENPDKKEYIQEELKNKRGTYPLAIEWFLENIQLLQSFHIKKFPIIMKSYENLLENPETTVQKVFSFIKKGNAESAMNAIEKDLFRSKNENNSPSYLEPKEIKLFDDLYYSIHQKSKIDSSLYKELLSLKLEIEKKYPKNIYGKKYNNLKDS